MKALLALGIAVLLTSTSAFADEGEVPPDIVARMGLRGMTPLSDAEALAIRGTPVFYWPTTESTFSIPGFQTRFVFQQEPMPVYGFGWSTGFSPYWYVPEGTGLRFIIRR
jgi:hypothetical protein